MDNWSREWLLQITRSPWHVINSRANAVTSFSEGQSKNGLPFFVLIQFSWTGKITGQREELPRQIVSKYHHIVSTDGTYKANAVHLVFNHTNYMQYLEFEHIHFVWSPKLILAIPQIVGQAHFA
ncbi:hypothetical protein [Sphingobacterium siyangense]|uniref:hypothetical protein n=1 Tax=Sphingobacterium siyangense TaxID=459529 RepID=UPI0031F80670